MRVIAGAHRGARLRAPPGGRTRPTGDRVREALFSILGDISGLRVLDLFAGSGALGIEALSRGAAHATFVERAPGALRALRANIEALAIPTDAAAVRARDARGFVRNARIAGRQYDLVFLDPPYRLARRLSAELSDALPPLLAPGARVVAESDRREPLQLELALARERRYGDTLIRIHSVDR